MAADDSNYNRKDYLQYNIVERGSDSKYPHWKDSSPNLKTYLDALNLSQPIISCKFELVWSRWPRTIFFAKNITVPGISVNTIEVSHAGFTIPIPTHVMYENTEITMNIIADKEGFHYYDLRNMVLQTGHPLVAGDPRATIGNIYNLSPSEDVLEVRLRNKPTDTVHHHWLIHNFHPTGIGDIEMSVDGGSFVEFELKGTFTHITYDCGEAGESETPPGGGEGGDGNAPGGDNGEQPQDDQDGFGETPDFGDPFDNPFNTDNDETDPDGGDEDEEDEGEDDGEYNDDQDWYDPDSEFGDDESPEDEPSNEDLEPFEDDYDGDEDDPTQDWEDWDNNDWGNYGDDDDPEFTVQGENAEVNNGDTPMTASTTSVTGEPPTNSDPQMDKGGYQDTANKFMNGQSNATNELAKDMEKEAEQSAQDDAPKDESTKKEESSQSAPKRTTLKQGNNTIVLNGMTKEQAVAASQTRLDNIKKQLDEAEKGKNTVVKNHLRRMYQLQKTAHNSLSKAEVISEERSMRKRSIDPSIQPMTLSQQRQLNSLVKAIKFNYGLDGKRKWKVTVKPKEEMKKYLERITQLSLPHRFGMYKTLKNNAKRVKIELEDPLDNLDSTTHGNPDPNHKVRQIFPLDD